MPRQDERRKARRSCDGMAQDSSRQDVEGYLEVEHHARRHSAHGKEDKVDGHDVGGIEALPHNPLCHAPPEQPKLALISKQTRAICHARTPSPIAGSEGQGEGAGGRAVAQRSSCAEASR